MIPSLSIFDFFRGRLLGSLALYMKPSRKAPPMVEVARARLTVDGHHKPLFLVLTVKIEEEEEQFFAFLLLLLFLPC